MEEPTKQDQAVDLRIVGHTYPEIAKRLGYNSRQAAQSAVRTSARWKAKAANESLEDGEDQRSRKPLTAAQKQCYDFIRGLYRDGRPFTDTCGDRASSEPGPVDYPSVCKDSGSQGLVGETR